MNRPALLLADEPTGALDTASGEDVQQLLTELHADGQTIVLVTHDLALAESCATRTVELVDGRIAADTAHGSWRPMSALGRVVRSGVGRRRVQTVVIALTTMMAVAASVLGGSLLVASEAPFDHAFAQQHGAHLTAQFDAAKATAAQLAATARRHRGHRRRRTVPDGLGHPGRRPGTGRLPPLTIVGRAGRGRPGRRGHADRRPVGDRARARSCCHGRPVAGATDPAIGDGADLLRTCPAARP